MGHGRRSYFLLLFFILFAVQGYKKACLPVPGEAKVTPPPRRARRAASEARSQNSPLTIRQNGPGNHFDRAPAVVPSLIDKRIRRASQLAASIGHCRKFLKI